MPEQIRDDSSVFQQERCEDGDRGFIMVSPIRLSALNAEFPEQLATVEGGIAREFSRRLHGFHIAIRNDGLVLEGRTKTYFSKQVVQEAVVNAIDLPIIANHIRVEDFRMVARERQALDCDPELDVLIQ